MTTGHSISALRTAVGVWITSEPWRDRQGRARTATLLLYANRELHVLLLKTGERQPGGDVTWRVDQGMEVTESWTRPSWAEAGDLVPHISTGVMRAMKGASRFSIKTPATPELTFLLDGALETSVQANLERCEPDGLP